jgi:hypothetical protein
MYSHIAWGESVAGQLESVHKTLYMAATGPPALAPETYFWVIEK